MHCRSAIANDLSSRLEGKEVGAEYVILSERVRLQLTPPFAKRPICLRAPFPATADCLLSPCGPEPRRSSRLSASTARAEPCRVPQEAQARAAPPTTSVMFTHAFRSAQRSCCFLLLVERHSSQSKEQSASVDTSGVASAGASGTWHASALVSLICSPLLSRVLRSSFRRSYTRVSFDSVRSIKPMELRARVIAAVIIAESPPELALTCATLFDF